MLSIMQGLRNLRIRLKQQPVRDLNGRVILKPGQCEFAPWEEYEILRPLMMIKRPRKFQVKVEWTI